MLRLDHLGELGWDPYQRVQNGQAGLDKIPDRLSIQKVLDVPESSEIERKVQAEVRRSRR